MKLDKVKTYNNKLLKLKLITTKIYKKKQDSFIKIEDIALRLKKAFSIIYKFHNHRKRILFVGSPANLDTTLKKLIQKTKHILIPKSVWMNGILTNQRSCFKYLKKNHKRINNKVSDLLFKLNKKNNLIVILDSLTNNAALSEGYLTRTPVISLNSELCMLDEKTTYKIPGNFRFTHKKIRDTFFCSILAATLKKASKNYKAPTKKLPFFKHKKPFWYKKKF